MAIRLPTKLGALSRRTAGRTSTDKGGEALHRWEVIARYSGELLKLIYIDRNMRGFSRKIVLF
jgi:hypothetical protein